MSYTLPAWADLPATSSALDTANLSLYNTAINDIDTRINNKQAVITVTAVKTTGYSAVAGDFVPVDTTSGNVTVTLPTAPPNGSRIGVKQVVRGGVNTVTVAAGGSDHFTTATGPTTDVLTLLNDSAIYQYTSATSVWMLQTDDSSLAQMDVRYRNVPVTLTDAATVATNAALGNYFRLTAAAGRILGAPTNPTDGQVCVWELLNNTGGTITFDLATSAAFNLGAITVTTTAAGKRDLVTGIYNTVLSKWLVLSIVKGY